jgi:hypothetical protein
MPNGLTPAKGEPGWVPLSQSEKDAVRAQLERILADPLFLNSKRYPSFLHHVVVQTLGGRSNQLKERTLGIQVFGREPDYDTGLDNVVRSTSGEIRRRLAQYYQDPAHETEIRIDLPAGSYVPRFQPPSRGEATAPARAAQKRGLWPKWASAAAVVCAAALLAWLSMRGAQSPIDRFWKPVLDAPGHVLLCVGSRLRADTENPPPGIATPRAVEQAAAKGQPIRDFPISSATALARFVGYLQVKNKPFNIREDANTQFSDLRDGPVILIGAFINQWAARLSQPLRFTIRGDPEGRVRLIHDGQAQPAREWANAEDISAVVEDYALISRFFDPNTGQIVVLAAGLHRHGTVAAGEFLTDPASMARLARQAPRFLEKRNLQVVLAAEVIENNPGKARILATHVW